MLPQLERALIAGHDVVLLGERGQGKTRLLRALSGLLDEWTPVIAGAELGEHPYTPITPESIRRAAELGRRPADRVAAPQRALHREAGHPGHQRGRPGRRHRPDQGRRGPQPRRSGDHRLRPDPAGAPRHRRRQRAARPGRAHPGVDAQRDGGARHPGARLHAAAAAGRARRRQRQPGGLHQPRAHHHPAEGPLRRRDPHALPAGARRRGRRHHARRRICPRRCPSYLLQILARFAPLPARVELGRPALGCVGAVRDRGRRDGRGVGPPPRRRCSASRIRWRGWSTSAR